MLPSKIELTQPDWVIREFEKLADHVVDIADRMLAVIRFARLNFEYQTGGPFAAGIFEETSGRLVAIGVNRVIPDNASSAHAEILAITLAQQILGTFDLGGPDMPSHQLVVNARPCAMCFGSIPWSGVRSVVIGATGAQVEQLTGFDEGPIHPHWQQQLHARGIRVSEDVLAEEAAAVLKAFGDSGLPVYNGRSGK
jgi:tRNA(Arg) A34 adenosine deaminase TadA